MSIAIRRATVQDVPAYARIMGDPAVFSGLLQMPYASDEVWKQCLIDAATPGKADLLLAAELDGDVMGTAGLHPVGQQIRRRHAWMLGISVMPQAQGRGVGTALMQAVCDCADNWIGALRLELGVYTYNAPALALHRKFNFQIEGMQRGYAFRDGRYVDSHLMVRLHPKPPTIDC